MLHLVSCSFQKPGSSDGLHGGSTLEDARRQVWGALVPDFLSVYFVPSPTEQNDRALTSAVPSKNILKPQFLLDIEFCWYPTAGFDVVCV